VFNAWIDHGVRPADASYAYEVLPAATPEQTAQRAKSPAVAVLSNTAQLQAVDHSMLKMLVAAFWTPGHVKDVQVDRPCLLMLRDGKLTASNPAHETVTLKVAVGQKMIDVKLPADGSSVTVDLR